MGADETSSPSLSSSVEVSPTAPAITSITGTVAAASVVASNWATTDGVSNRVVGVEWLGIVVGGLVLWMGWV